MQLSTKYVEALRTAVALASRGDQIRIAELKTFPGATPFSKRPTIFCTLECNFPPKRRSELDAQMRQGFHDLFKPATKQTLKSRVDAQLVADYAVRLAASFLDGLTGEEPSFGLVSADAQRATFWIDYLLQVPAQQAILTAIVGVSEALFGPAGQPSLSTNEYTRLRRMCEQQQPSPHSRTLFAAARQRDIPVLQIAGDPSLWQYGWGRRAVRFFETSSNYDGLVAFPTSKNKALAKQMFRELALPTPEWRTAGPQDDVRELAQAVGFPCVIKPFDRGSGKGVTANIATEKELDEAVAAAREFSQIILVEAHVSGDDHRLMVIDGRLVRAVRREPASVVGDGKSSVRVLLAELNRKREGSPEQAGHLVPVKPDAGVSAMLARQGLQFDSVPKRGQRVLLRSVANRSSGGHAIDVTDRIHPDLELLSEQLAAAFGFRCTGIDYITTDISLPPAQSGGVFIEINATPGLGVLLASGMKEEAVGSMILGALPGRIPVRLLVTAPDEVEAACDAIRTSIGSSEAVATSQAGWFNSVPLPLNGCEGVSPVTALLCYPGVEGLHIVWSEDHLHQLGSPVDAYDQIVVASPLADHAWRELLERSTPDFAVASNLADGLKLMQVAKVTAAAGSA